MTTILDRRASVILQAMVVLALAAQPPAAVAVPNAAMLAQRLRSAVKQHALDAAPARALLHEPRRAQPISLPAPLATASNSDAIYFLGLEPPWLELSDSPGVDFLLQVPHGDQQEVTVVAAIGASLLWVTGDQPPVLLPDTGLTPPYRLLAADVLPAPGVELLVAGGSGMVAGAWPPTGWTPLAATAPGHIDGLVALPGQEDDPELVLIAAIGGTLWLTTPGATSWQPAALPYPGQPPNITALAAPLKPYSILLAWDGSTLSTLEIANDAGGGQNIRWRPFPVQPTFPTTALSAYPGFDFDALLFATGSDGVYQLDLEKAAVGSGWKGPFNTGDETSAITWWHADGRPWLVVTSHADGFRRMPLDAGPGAAFESFSAPALGRVRGLATLDGELVALDCCALRALRPGGWQRLPAAQQPRLEATTLGELDGRLVVSDGRLVERLDPGGWSVLPPLPGGGIQDLAGFSIIGSPRDDLIAVAGASLRALDLDLSPPAWQTVDGLRFSPRLIAAGESLGEEGGGLILLVDRAAEQARAGGIRFERTEPPGLANYRYDGEGHSPGAVLADFDGDGAPDLYLPQSDGPNELWRNIDGVFEPLPAAAGADDARHSTGAVAADYDGDGDLDLYVVNFLQNPIHPTQAQIGQADMGRNTLYANRLAETGSLAFEDVTMTTVAAATPGQPQLGVGFAVDPASGDELLARSLTATWGDYDRDGDLDLFVGNHAGNYDAIPGQRHVLYRNVGNGTFEDVTLRAGVAGGDIEPGIHRYGASQASVFADLDNNGRLDLYVSDKMGTPMGGSDPPDHLYRNRGNGTFEDWHDPFDPLFGLITGGAMGIATGDHDNDGDLDLYLTDATLPERLRRNTGENDFYRNRIAEDGSLRWERLPQQAPGAFSWGTNFFDADLDGDLDLWVTTSAGYLDFLYRNELRESGMPAYTDVAAGAGTARAGENRAVLTGDLDDDGRLDAVVVSRDEGVAVFHNVTPFEGRHWLKVRIAEQAVGARITVAADLDHSGAIGPRETQIREIAAGGNTCASTSEPIGHFGLGQATSARVDVRLADGRMFHLAEVPADQQLEVGGEPPGVCTPDDTTLCLNDDRFRVQVQWRKFDDGIGSGHVVPFSSPDSGLFYFFRPDNWELMVKVLDACSNASHRFWVFAAATTNVEYTLTVTDTATGRVKQYFKPLGVSAPAITDTQAFATCP